MPYIPVGQWPDPYDPIDSMSPSNSVFRPDRTVFVLTKFNMVPADKYKERQERLIRQLNILYHAYGIRANLKFLRIDPSEYTKTTVYKRSLAFAGLIDKADLVVIDSSLTIKFNYDLRILLLYIQKNDIPYIWLDPVRCIIRKSYDTDFEFVSRGDNDLLVQEYIIDTEEVTKEELLKYERETEEEW